MRSPHRNRLFVMMVLQLFIWGAWLPLIFPFLPGLGFNAAQQAAILNAFPIAALVGMFFSNQFADRSFAAERFMAFSHLVGGLAILALGFVSSFWPFLILMLVHCLLYVPTLSIANSIAFTHMKDAQKEFGFVRMGGTVGWILAAWPFTFILVDWAKVNATPTTGLVSWLDVVFSSSLKGQAFLDGVRWTYIVSGVASLVLAAFSLTLPHTPPKPAEGADDKQVWLGALRLLKQPFVLVLWIVTFLDSFVHNCYFNWAGFFLPSPQVGIPENWVMPVMSIGQVAEILTMFVLGVTLKKLGWRATMIVGVLGHVIRFIVFAYLPQHQWLIVGVNLIHGVCYAFFFATVYIFADAYFPKNARTSAQGLFNVMILGLGCLVANTICPPLRELFTQNGVTDFKNLFLVPSAAGLFGVFLLAFAFHPPKQEASVEKISAPVH